MKAALFGFGVVLALSPVANAQSWQQWQQQNPTYSGGASPTKRSGHIPQVSPAASPTTRSTSETLTQVRTKATQEGHVQVMSATISPTAAHPWINVKLQNLTTATVSEVWVEYDILNGTNVQDSGSFKISSTLNRAESNADRYPLMSLPMGSLQTKYTIRIRSVTWRNEDGTSGINTQWGQMLFF
jgi:hypothetical protein